MYWKSLLQANLDGILAVLKRHSIDTSKFEENVASIINNGVMMSGGQLSANQVAVGQNATATSKFVDSITQPVKQVLNRPNSSEKS